VSKAIHKRAIKEITVRQSRSEIETGGGNVAKKKKSWKIVLELERKRFRRYLGFFYETENGLMI
jgi:hypothetical protein